jgi:predicted nucleic acid-binding protein
MRESPDQKVIEWLDRQPAASVWTNAVTILEVRFGLQIMARGKRRARLINALEAALEAIGGRIAPFDDAAAMRAAELMAFRQQRGRPGEWRDTMIAGIVLAHHATLATRNTAHFGDISVPVVNPWTASV